MAQAGLDETIARRIGELRAEHARLETRLQELERHLSLTSSEQLERAELKKRKLRVKDHLAIAIREERTSAPR